MTWIQRNIHWIMRISGALTFTMLLSALSPQIGLQTTFGVTPTLEPFADIVVRNWGALIAMVGLLLLYAARRPELRPLVLVVAIASKVIFMALVVTLGQAYLGTAGLAVVVDTVMVVLFAAYLWAEQGGNPTAAVNTAALTAPDGPVSIVAADAPLRARPSTYPPVFAKLMVGREKQPLGDLFSLKNFGVNRTVLAPGAVSALRHAHSRQDEFIFILQGSPTLLSDRGETALEPGMCAGFPHGTGNAHALVNRSTEPVTYLEVGDRTRGDSVHYPDDDLAASFGSDGTWRFSHKDGRPIVLG